jgi:hypothetical protein
VFDAIGIVEDNDSTIIGVVIAKQWIVVRVMLSGLRDLLISPERSLSRDTFILQLWENLNCFTIDGLEVNINHYIELFILN